MQKIEKHPIHEGKYQCPHCEYGHEKGVSKQAVYKHFRTVHKDTVQKEEPETIIEDVQESESESSFEFDTISWLDDEEEFDDVTNTIPEPIARIASSKEGKELMMAHQIMEGTLIRAGFISIDRLITWYGKSITNNADYELKRSASDYKVLQESTHTMLQAYGIRVPASPVMIWSTIMASAYVPPIVDISKNADPNKRWMILGRIRNLIKMPKFRRRRKKNASTDN